MTPWKETMNRNRSKPTFQSSESLSSETIHTPGVIGDNPSEAEAELQAQANEQRQKELEREKKELEEKIISMTEKYNNAFNATFNEIMNGVVKQKEGDK